MPQQSQFESINFSELLALDESDVNRWSMVCVAAAKQSSQLTFDRLAFISRWTGRESVGQQENGRTRNEIRSRNFCWLAAAGEWIQVNYLICVYLWTARSLAFTNRSQIKHPKGRRCARKAHGIFSEQIIGNWYWFWFHRIAPRFLAKRSAETHNAGVQWNVQWRRNLIGLGSFHCGQIITVQASDCSIDAANVAYTVCLFQILSQFHLSGARRGRNCAARRAVE